MELRRMGGKRWGGGGGREKVPCSFQGSQAYPSLAPVGIHAYGHHAQTCTVLGGSFGIPGWLLTSEDGEVLARYGWIQVGMGEGRSMSGGR